MYQQFIPAGPDAGSAPTSKFDRTRILEPLDFWRDPMSCPDWPALRPDQRYEGRRGKEGAEARLEAIGAYLNRGPGTLRLPTDEEREEAFARTFQRTGTPYHFLGIVNLSPLTRVVEDDAQLIVEACHLRGYLRKLDAKAVRDAEAAKEARDREARRSLEEYRTAAPGMIAEMDELAEAVARHKQRLEDERAVSRRYALWQSLNAMHGAAVSAAHTLGLSVPDAPAALD